MFGLLAVGFMVSRARVKKRPAIREMLASTGSIAGIVTGDKLLRVILQSGDEIVLPVTGSKQQTVLNLLRGHSPNARVTTL